nr:MAG TPA: hypothetical protein [Caudoviricetes sp.]
MYAQIHIKTKFLCDAGSNTADVPIGLNTEKI